MSRRFVRLVFVFAIAVRADGAWWPVFEPRYVQIRPGETVTINVHAAWLSGVSLVPFMPMTFISADPAVAAVEGFLPTTSAAPLRITGLQPGITRAVVLERPGPPMPTSAIIVVAAAELPVDISITGVIAKGHPITLTAVSDEPDATFTWFSGSPTGLYTWFAATGREYVFTPEFDAFFDFWVLMTSPRGAGIASAGVNVSPRPARRRAVR